MKVLLKSKGNDYSEALTIGSKAFAILLLVTVAVTFTVRTTVPTMGLVVCAARDTRSRAARVARLPCKLTSKIHFGW